MKISIVTTTFNSEKTIADTLESVLSQTHSDIEHIIVDGASKDSTMEIVKSYELRYNGRLRYISEPDTGIYNAMNKGLKMATGDVVCTLNSDDILSSNTSLEYMAKAFDDPTIECAFANVNIVSATDITKVIRKKSTGPYFEGAFLKGWHPAHPAFFVKNEVYKKYGYFDESFKIAADIDLMYRFLETHKIKGKYQENVVTLQRNGGASTTIMGHIKGNLEVVKAMKKNGCKISILFLPRRILPKVINQIKVALKLQ